jgi:hypothetical protein
LHLCLNQPAAAKKDLLDALQQESTRDNVVGFVQPSDELPDPSAWSKRQYVAQQALSSDPELLRAIEPYGRVLPWPVNQAAKAAP